MECDGKCQSISKPCNGKCINKKKPIVCGDECIREHEVYENSGKLKVNENWPAPVLFNYLQECDGKCVNVKSLCNGKCIHKTFSHRCGDSCIQKDEAESYWECQGKCLPHKEPCNGTCPKRAPHLCYGKCVDESMYKSEFQDCNGKCIGLSIPCNGKCLHPNYPERCIDHCLDANTFCKGDWGEMKSTKMI